MPLLAATFPALPRAHGLLLSTVFALAGCAEGCGEATKPNASADGAAAPATPTAAAVQESAAAAPPASVDASESGGDSQGVSSFGPAEPAPAVLPKTRSGKVLRLPKGGTLKPVRALPPLTHPSARETP